MVDPRAEFLRALFFGIVFSAPSVCELVFSSSSVPYTEELLRFRLLANLHEPQMSYCASLFAVDAFEKSRDVSPQQRLRQRCCLCVLFTLGPQL